MYFADSTRPFLVAISMVLSVVALIIMIIVILGVIIYVSASKKRYKMQNINPDHPLQDTG